MLGVEALIVFAVASFHFAVVPRRICTDLLVYYSVYAKYSLEQCRIRLSAFVVPEVFGELLPIVRLHTFNRKLKVLNRMLQKYCGGMAAVLLKRFQIALSRELVYCRELEESSLFCHSHRAFEWHIFAVYLHTFPGVAHSLIWLWRVFRLLLSRFIEISQAAHNSYNEATLRA